MRTKKLKVLSSSLSLLMAVSMVGATSAFAAPAENDNTTSIEVDSHWIGSEGESLTVNLLANDEPVDTATLSGASDWSHVFEDVAVTDGENPITYTIEQVQDIEGYHSHISGGVTQGFDIVHLESPDNPGFEGESINVDVSKSWVGTIGEEAHINLLVDGIEAAEITLSATTSADTGWDYTFENLPVVENANGEPVTYTVSEDNMEGYDTKIFGTQEQGFLVHNIDVTIPEMIIEGSVVVKYVDEDGNEIALPNTFTGEVGQKYGTTGKDIPGYSLIGVQGEDRGTFEADGTEVVYVYEPKTGNGEDEAYVEGTIVVKHQNEDGEEIALREIHTGEVGTKYDVKPKDIRGYDKLLRTESDIWNSPGTFGEGIAIITFTYEVDKSIAEEAPVIGSVVTKYVDEDNNEIAERERISGEIGEDYELEPKEINGYEFVEAIGEVAGQFGEGISIVEYVYAASEEEQEEVVESTVTVNHVDQAKNKIAEPVVIKGEVGEEYTTEPLEIDGYKLYASEGYTTGEFAEDNITVTYVYEALAITTPVEPIDEEKEEEITTPVEPVEEENKNKEAKENLLSCEALWEMFPGGEITEGNLSPEDPNYDLINRSFDALDTDNDGVICEQEVEVDDTETPVNLNNNSNNSNNNNTNDVAAVDIDLEAAYDKLEFGMSYDDVVDLIGKEGTVDAENTATFNDQIVAEATIYTWVNNKGDALSAGFVNDKMVSKALAIDGNVKADYATQETIDEYANSGTNSDNNNTESMNLNEPKQQDGQALPDTATNTFNILAIGGGLLAAAGVGLFIVNRRRAAIDSE